MKNNEYSRTGTMDAVDTSRLVPLGRLNDFEVSDNDSDVRGWDVMSSDNRKIGEVEELLVDTEARRVRYLAVSLDRPGASQGGHVLIPVESVRLSDRNQRVLLDSVSGSDVSSLPAYDFNSFNRGDEAGFRPPNDTEREARVTVSEEELAVGKRRVAAGEVGIEKHVETERVQQRVPVTREEVTVERRPVSAASSGAARIEEDEIRVPLTQEEVIVEKRVVPKEELVIKKHQVQDEKLVEETVRRERAEVNRVGGADVTDTVREEERARRR
jgi:uncharacterized protein (TIGR02271 family)